MLRRRLESVLRDNPYAVDTGLVALLRTLTEELGADDPLTVEAAYRKTQLWAGVGDLEIVVPRMMRVLGPDDPLTVEGRLRLVLELAHAAADGRSHAAEMAEVVAQAAHVLGANDPQVTWARIALPLHLARQGEPVRDELALPSAARAAREREQLEPVMAQLGPSVPLIVRILARRILATAAYRMGDYPAAARHFEATGLVPGDEVVAHPEAAYWWGASLGESGHTQQALAILRPLSESLKRSAHPLRAEARAAVKKYRRTRAATSVERHRNVITRRWRPGP
ncbi:hypothetical protein ACFWP3_39215 [Streptomyces sp. NPDC058525]|uniref:hypothetical protein n=1 Tax=Streptomyces sp. NPDC058525 TaxID=3346538 RepID=UPI003657614F